MPAPYSWAGWEFDTLADVKRAVEEEADAWLKKFKGGGVADLVFKRGHAAKEVEVTVRLRDH